MKFILTFFFFAIHFLRMFVYHDMLFECKLMGWWYLDNCDVWTFRWLLNECCQLSSWLSDVVKWNLLNKAFICFYNIYQQNLSYVRSKQKKIVSLSNMQCQQNIQFIFCVFRGFSLNWHLTFNISHSSNTVILCYFILSSFFSV